MKRLWELTWGRFWQSRWAFSRVYLAVTIVITALAIPVLKGLVYVGQWLDNVPFLSLSNFKQMLLQNPAFTVILIMAIVALLAVFAWQAVSYVLGFSAIHAGQKPTALSAIKQAGYQIRRMGFGRSALIVAYGLLALPFPMLIFHSALLTDVKIPEFVWPTIMATTWMWGTLAILFVGALFLAIRFFYVLPELVLHQQSAKTALRNSWQKTTGWAGWRLVFKLFFGSLLIGAMTLLAFGVTYLLQLGIDQLGNLDVSALGAVLTFILATLSDILFSIVGLQFVFGLMTRDYQVVALTDFVSKSKRSKRWVGAFLILNLIVQGATPSFWFVVNTANRHMKIISHRGIDGGNGVQNTIPALQDTVAKAHPDYVEMDIRQTKDGKWVLMHDPNLTTLTKGASNKSISDLTLQQATALTVYENGHTAKIPSFAAYAKAAERAHVKLLVEIKTERQTAPDLADSFLKQFKTVMDQNGWEMHSLNYSVVQRLKKLDPKLPVGMILPGDFVGNPVTSADFYTMEYSFLTREQVESLNELRKGVYAWTVNDETGMVAAYSQGVQGEITDDATTLHAVMQDSDKARLMHQKLGRYIVNILAE